MTQTSYASGTSDLPLLGDTIGTNLAHTVARFPDRTALVDRPSGRRWTYAELDADVDAGRPRPAGGRGRGRATGSASGRRTAPSGCSSSTPPPRSARSWSTSTRPTAPTSWPTCCASPACACWSRPSRSRPATTGDGRRGPRRLPGAASRWSSSARRPGTALVAAAPPSATDGARERGGGAVLRRPDQHPVHVGHDRLPEGRDAVAPQHPQQRLLRRRACAASPRTTGCACRCPSTTASGW